MKIILSTRNPSKALQISQIFEGSRISVLTLDDAGIEGEGVEDGTTLDENAFKKARFAYDHRPQKNLWTMADDTGFFITALNGAPGIRAARWAGDTATTDEITQHTLNMLKGATDRSAYFETAVALISPEGHRYMFSGKASGSILEVQRVPPQPKMPYSGIFVPDGYTRSWAEMATEEENVISHRGKAFREVKGFIESLFKL